MEKLNHQTKKKIEEVKQLINDRIELRDIIKLKFNTANKKNNWLKDNKQYFTPQELLYLEFVETPELIEVEEIEEKREEKQLPTISFSNISKIEKLSTNERMALLLSDETLQALQSLINSQSVQNQETQIPLEYLRLTDIKVKNCRISDSIYNNLVEYCNKNNLTITSVLNYIIDTFLKSKK